MRSLREYLLDETHLVPAAAVIPVPLINGKKQRQTTRSLIGNKDMDVYKRYWSYTKAL